MSASVRGRILVIGDEETLPLFRSIGATTREAKGDSEVAGILRNEASRGDLALVIVLRHVVEDEDYIRAEARRLGVPLILLPTRWSKIQPIDINRLIAKALGFG